jgi:hypothetical protein
VALAGGVYSLGLRRIEKQTRTGSLTRWGGGVLEDSLNAAAFAQAGLTATLTQTSEAAIEMDSVLSQHGPARCAALHEAPISQDARGPVRGP